MISNERVIKFIDQQEYYIKRASNKTSNRNPQINNLYFNNNHLSKNHAVIQYDKFNTITPFTIKDNESTFGTVVNDHVLLPNTKIGLSNKDKLGLIISLPSNQINQIFEENLNESNLNQTIQLSKFKGAKINMEFQIFINGNIIKFVPINNNNINKVNSATANGNKLKENASNSPIDLTNSDHTVEIKVIDKKDDKVSGTETKSINNDNIDQENLVQKNQTNNEVIQLESEEEEDPFGDAEEDASVVLISSTKSDKDVYSATTTPFGYEDDEDVNLSREKEKIDGHEDEISSGLETPSGEEKDLDDDEYSDFVEDEAPSEHCIEYDEQVKDRIKYLFENTSITHRSFDCQKCFKHPAIYGFGGDLFCKSCQQGFEDYCLKDDMEKDEIRKEIEKSPAYISHLETCPNPRICECFEKEVAAEQCRRAGIELESEEEEEEDEEGVDEEDLAQEEEELEEKEELEEEELSDDSGEYNAEKYFVDSDSDEDEDEDGYGYSYVKGCCCETEDDEIDEEEVVVINYNKTRDIADFADDVFPKWRPASPKVISPSTTKKRSFEEMEEENFSTNSIEDDDHSTFIDSDESLEEIDFADEPPKKKQLLGSSSNSSNLKTVLKEVGKGVFYVAATITALGIYGSQISDESTFN
ncbi:hypothetical protein KGF54_002822 [Candida jiufengensis]|uniref:uncharacterized protein n=1 Tax=Candida jiufengensis TaxID=497108 RepID=UPI0022250A8D|nr:uncharacterized protein KGF54_002822 [Candida jiufengensis]KAI5953450.1 hypothetical protein KGF54_002822 [Candida jiufengensis]